MINNHEIGYKIYGEELKFIRIIQYSPQMGHRREEGIILGGLGNLLDGDGF